MRVRLPPGLPGEKTLVMMHVTPYYVPPPSTAPEPDAAVDGSAVSPVLQIFPKATPHYEKASIKQAFEKLRSPLIACQDGELARNAAQGIAFNVLVKHDGRGAIEKIDLEAQELSVRFNDCVREVLKVLSLPTPKDKTPGLVKTTFIITPG